MRWVMFCHSIRSDWNHGHAHFLRGMAREILDRGDELAIHEPETGWSRRNLMRDHGPEAQWAYKEAYPRLESRTYPPEGPDLDRALQDADIVLVHEWNDPELVRAIGRHHMANRNYNVYFHDNHHKALSQPWAIQDLDLHAYTGVLAFGDSLRRTYLQRDWTDQAWTWHEAADEKVFRPLPAEQEKKDLVWVGNWGDEERSAELEEFLVGPVRRLGLDATVHGVRYPKRTRDRLEEAGIAYKDWIANHHVPQAFADHRATVHIPRQPYLQALPGIPTIRMFEAFASGIPLAVARWEDTEGLFSEGRDHQVAQDGEEMTALLRSLLEDEDRALRMAQNARRTIEQRHTCRHRLEELIGIDRSVQGMGASKKLHIAFFGSSILSSYWNGAATYYRGLLGALAQQGYRVTFYEPAIEERQQNPDMEAPPWAEVVVYRGEKETQDALRAAAEADVVVKASGVRGHDEVLEQGLAELGRQGCRTVYWDVDAPATLKRLHEDPDDPLRRLLPKYDAVFTYGGGPRVVREFLALGAQRCVPVFNAVDPLEHYPVEKDREMEVDLAFLGNRLPDREARVEEFFFRPARELPDRSFLLGGAGWEPHQIPDNTRYLGHVGTQQHNAFNSSPMAVLNINRASMAEYGHSPPTRVFEAAGAGACIITDDWPGIDGFLKPGEEILVAQDGNDVKAILEDLDPEKAQRIGRAARRRVLREHTYGQRALHVMRELDTLERKELIA